LVANDITFSPIAGAWTDWTPTVTQTGAVTKTVTKARYLQVGKLVIVNFDLAITGSGTGSSSVIVSLPVTPLTAHARMVGSGQILDISTTTSYACSIGIVSGSLQFYNDASQNSSWGFYPSTALANGDAVNGTVTYEAA
jgi:hypothetical protein